jgi:hypothetical protein
MTAADRVIIDLYLRSASGSSLHETIVSGQPLTGDLSRFAADPQHKAALLTHLERLQEERWLWSVVDDALLVRVYGLPRALSRVFGCDVRSTGVDTCKFFGVPSLPGYDCWIEAIESTGRAVRGTPTSRCAVRGHDWDILLFDSPHGLLECMCCGKRHWDSGMPVRPSA